MAGAKNEIQLQFSNEQNLHDIHRCKIYELQPNSVIYDQEDSSKECVAKQKENLPLFSKYFHSRTHSSNNVGNNSYCKKKNIIRRSKLKQVVSKLLSDSKSPVSQVGKTMDNLSESFVKIDTQKVKLWSLENKRHSLSNNCNKGSGFISKIPYSVLTQDFKSLNIKENNAFSDLTSLKVNLPLKWEDRDLSLSNSFNDDEVEDNESSVDTVLPDLRALSLSGIALGCANQARTQEDVSTDELAAYLDNYLHFPKKMSYMAEMMYT